jgi:hypothetical protein
MEHPMLHPLSQALRDATGLVDARLNTAAADELDRLVLHVADLTQMLANAAPRFTPPPAAQPVSTPGLDAQITELQATLANLTVTSAANVQALRTENDKLKDRIAALESSRGD